jgi:hypothetical protein
MAVQKIEDALHKVKIVANDVLEAVKAMLGD